VGRVLTFDRVLDTSVVLAIVLGEPGADTARGFIENAGLSVVNRKRSPRRARS